MHSLSRFEPATSACPADGKDDTKPLSDAALRAGLEEFSRITSVDQPPRPKTAHETRPFHLPLPFSAVETLERTLDLRLTNSTIEYQDGEESFLFPTPSTSRPLPLRSATFSTRKTYLQLNSPRIGVAIGSPSQLRGWGWSPTLSPSSKQTLPEPSPPPPPPPLKVRPRIPTPLKNERPAEDANAPSPDDKKNNWKSFGRLLRRQSKSKLHEGSVKNTSSDSRGRTKRTQAPPLSEALPLEPNPFSSPSNSTVKSLSTSTTLSRNRSLPRAFMRIEARVDACLASGGQGAIPTTQLPTINQSRHPVADLPGTSTKLEKPNVVGLGLEASAFGGRASSTVQPAHDISPESGNVTSAVDSPRIDLDMPDLSFDRYSVMFRDLLNSKPTLLERRLSRIPASNSGKEVPSGPLRPLPLRTFATMHGGGASTSTSATSGQPWSLKRSHTVPSGATSPMENGFLQVKVPRSIFTASPGSPIDDEYSLPPTPSTVYTYGSDFEVIVSASLLSPHVGAMGKAGRASWSPVVDRPSALYQQQHNSNGEPNLLNHPFFRLQEPLELDRGVTKVSLARQVPVHPTRRHACETSLASKQVFQQPRVVKLHKSKKSTAVEIEEVLLD